MRGPAAYADLDQFLAQLARIGARVCRIERLHGDGLPPQPLGTGFLVSDDRVLTNKHVADALPAEGGQIGCRFDYRALPGSTAVRPGVLVQAHSSTPVLAQRDYADSDVHEGGAPPTPQQLDYALLRLAEPAGQLSFSEDDCTNQRGLKPVVHTAPDSQISGLLCTKLVYAQYSCAPKRVEHGDRYPTDSRARRGDPDRSGMGACAPSCRDHRAIGAV